MKNQIIERLNIIVSHGIQAYNFRIQTNDWAKGGHDRTYFSIIETCTGTRHYKKYNYGYVDNNTGEYVPGDKDAREDYTVDGRSF